MFYIGKFCYSTCIQDGEYQSTGCIRAPCVHHVSRPTWSETCKIEQISAENPQYVREFGRCTIRNLWNRSADQSRKHQLFEENLRDDRQFIEFAHIIVVSKLMQKIHHHMRLESTVYVFQASKLDIGL